MDEMRDRKGSDNQFELSHLTTAGTLIMSEHTGAASGQKEPFMFPVLECFHLYAIDTLRYVYCDIPDCQIHHRNTRKKKRAGTRDSESL